MGNVGMLVQFPAGSKGISLLPNVQTGSGASSKEAEEFLFCVKTV